MMLSGNLTDWSVGDLLQMLHITKKTASLHVNGADRYGVVHFEDGAVINADVSLGGGAARDPKDEVIEAIYVLELLDEGTFEIKGEVPSRTIEPTSVADALELAGQYLAAERHLDETGLLAARGLRLAQTIDEPIILSEQVWNAISGSIPAFTFPELEERMGRAAAVATVEQFRDLGILEAVLEEPERAEETPQAPIEHIEIIEPVEAVGPDWSDQASEPEAVPVMIGEATAVEADETPDLGWGSHLVDDPQIAVDPGSVETTDRDGAVSEAPDDGMIVPVSVEEIRPIVSEAPERDIVVEPIEDQETSPPEPAPAPVAPSLSAAIRAAAGAGTDEPGHSDDESSLLSETAGPGDESDSDRDGSVRRTVRSLVSEPKTPLTSGMLGDLGSRIRQAAASERDD